MRSDQVKTVLIVGASSGIGRTCALHLARCGHRVFGTTRQPTSDVEATLRQELASSDRLEIVTMDVDEAASVSAGVREVEEHAGRIDAVVNCAGFGIGGSIEDTDDDEAKAIFETNLFGTLRVCRAVLPIMRRQGSGTIINISSIGGRIAGPFVGLYSATKFAVEGLSESLRMEVHRFGVRVVLVAGDFSTGFTDSRKPSESTFEPRFPISRCRSSGPAASGTPSVCTTPDWGSSRRISSGFSSGRFGDARIAPVAGSG